MRTIKMLSLAAVAAVAATAFVGAGTASAHFRGYCFLDQRLCELPWVIVLAGWISWVPIGAAKFEGGLNEECEKAAAKSNEVANELADEGAMEGTIESFTFSGCKPCKSVKVNGLPIKTSLNIMNEEKEETPNWLMKLTEFSVSFEECALGAKCKFAGEATAFVELTEKEAILNSNKAKLTLKEGNESLCGASVQWAQRLGYRYILDNAPFFTEDVIWPTIFI